VVFNEAARTALDPLDTNEQRRVNVDANYFALKLPGAV
jgi:hypothetical protein